MSKLRLNLAQRIVLVVALGAGLYVFGCWATARGSETNWVGFVPLSGAELVSPGGLHPWVWLVIWVLLIAVWAVASLLALRRRPVSAD